MYRRDERFRNVSFPTLAYSYFTHAPPTPPNTFHTCLEHNGSVYSWRGKKAKKDYFGWIPPNDFELEQYKFEFRELGRIETEKYYTPIANHRVVYSGFPAFFTPLTVAVLRNHAHALQSRASAALSQAQMEAYETANGPDCPGLTWVAEAGETASWAADILRSFWKIVKRIKLSEVDAVLTSAKSLSKRRPKASGKSPNLDLADSKVADKWLEYRYAITPLALQLEEIVQLLVEERSEKLETQSGFVENIDELTVDTVTRDLTSCKLYAKHDVQAIVRGACKLYPSAMRQETDYGFTPWDAISAAWEITRLSFVIDWFVNVGLWIGAHRPGGAVIRYQSNTSVISVREMFDVSRYEVYQPYSVQRFEPCKWSQSYNIVIRSTEVELPELPRFNIEALSLQRKLDAVALITKLLRRK